MIGSLFDDCSVAHTQSRRIARTGRYEARKESRKIGKTVEILAQKEYYTKEETCQSPSVPVPASHRRTFMADILHDLSTPKLVAAIEENLYSFMDILQRWPRAEVHRQPGVTWCITDVPFPLFNSIMRTRLSSDAADGVIESIIAKAELRHVPLSWWTGPTTHPVELCMHLRHHGFRESEAAPGMAVTLSEVDARRSVVPGLSIEIVRDPVGLTQWGLTSSLGFGAPVEEAERLAPVWCDLLCCADPDASFPFVGYLDGKPVATSWLIYGAGVAGIYAVGTLPEARRKGIGAAMTTRPLLDARNAGYKAGILQSSEMGHSVYRSLGFREYCKVYEYIWVPPAG